MLDPHSPLLPPGVIGPADADAPELALPLLSNRVTCGFPSPAEDFFGENDTLPYRHDDELTIACGYAALRPVRIQRAGKPAMDTEAFLRGKPVAAGTIVG